MEVATLGRLGSEGLNWLCRNVNLETEKVFHLLNKISLQALPFRDAVLRRIYMHRSNVTR